MLKKIWKRLPQPLRDKFFALVFASRRIDRRDPSDRRPEPFYVCGALRSNSGLGRSARLYARQLESRGHRVYRVDLTGAMRMSADFPLSPDSLLPSDLAGHTGDGTIVIHANPPQFHLGILALPKIFLLPKILVAYWVWEATSLPPLWVAAFQYVNAVETPSNFTHNVLSAYTDRPVHIHPHMVETPQYAACRQRSDNILRCLNIFDAGSSFDRKNPEAILESFARAFNPGEAELTFKISHAAADPRRFRSFRAACASVPGTRIMEETLSWPQMERLYHSHDVYISLHRSEGFGLTIREALNMGLYVLATGWSGNMDFMNHPKAMAVPCKIVSRQFRSGAYKDLPNSWAEPDTSQCAAMLRDLRDRIIGDAS